MRCWQRAQYFKCEYVECWYFKCSAPKVAASLTEALKRQGVPMAPSGKTAIQDRIGDKGKALEAALLQAAHGIAPTDEEQAIGHYQAPFRS